MPIKVALLWHMHQPNYQEPQSRRLVLPWVRLHALKDYLDMPLLAAEQENVRVTFNLVPALLDQLQLYVDGGVDRHFELSRIPADQLSDELRREILSTFFAGHAATLIEPYPRYAELFRKYRTNLGEPVLPALFTSEELRDLQVWSNLSWVDPLFRDEEPVRTLLVRGRYFSEDQKQRLLDWQISFIDRIVPTYRRLFQEGRIDVSFTPYYHPILPLLCDTDAAKEAIPGINLPARRFRHPEDAEWHILKSKESYQELFGKEMVGMWPSEGSVSEDVAALCLKHGIRWIATDEEILYASLRKAGQDRSANPPHTVYSYGSGLHLLFRDHSLSDRIGFVYSSWDADRAVSDLVAQIKAIGHRTKGMGIDPVVPIILDGENAWEYYPNDGRDFLQLLYQRLATDRELRTVTVTEAISTVAPRPLPRLFAGSWINHNFRIWIGHHEDNAAWDLLGAARDRLESFEEEHPEFDPERLAAAWQQIHIAEGSDWCWWYGDEHRGQGNVTFDRIFRRHLVAVYDLLGLEVPDQLWVPIYQGETKSQTTPPDTLLSPEVDGRVTHFYEWSGAGIYDCLEAGGSMHRVERYLSTIYFVYDHERLYIRLDFVSKRILDSIKEPVIQLAFHGPEGRKIVENLSRGQTRVDPQGHYTAALGDVFEIGIARDWLFDEGFGKLEFGVTLSDGRQKLESWPEGKPIALEVYERNRELFWS